MADWPPWFSLLVAVLATWRGARFITREDGPFDLIVRLRRHAGSGSFGQLMDCPYCLSLWLAMPWAPFLADSAVAGVLSWLAISGGAAFLENLLECLASRRE